MRKDIPPLPEFDHRAYADEHGKVEFRSLTAEPKDRLSTYTGHDYKLTLWHNENHSMAMGLTRNQALSLLNQMLEVLE